MSASRRPSIHVLAGVNGAGKSSIGGATVRQHGGVYFNPDEAARALMKANPALTQADANGAAWRQGVRLLKRAIEERLDFAFETTLGGTPSQASSRKPPNEESRYTSGMWGCPARNCTSNRVQARVSQGGHDIPESDIHRRYEHSRLNLIALLPHITTLHVYDNSAEADPAAGRTPKPAPVLHMEHGRILGPPDLASTPNWAKPIVAAALKLNQP